VSNRDRHDSLYAGWQVTGGELISFGTFVAGVEEFERVLAERSLDRQYEYERARRQQMNDEEAEWDIIEKRSKDAQRARG
jgi:hypothetical protein